jgi:hypothetical protein
LFFAIHVELEFARIEIGNGRIGVRHQVAVHGRDVVLGLFGQHSHQLLIRREWLANVESKDELVDALQVRNLGRKVVGIKPSPARHALVVIVEDPLQAFNVFKD